MTLILLDPADDVAVAASEVARGSVVPVTGRGDLSIGDDVPAGHKVALRDLPAGTTVRKYGQVVGETTTPIAAGCHVHTHNLSMPADPAARLTKAHAEPSSGARPPAVSPPAVSPGTVSPGTVSRSRGTRAARPTFLGIERSDGRVATRNYVGVLTTVNCSATVARQVAARCEDQLPEGVDGVVALTHGTGCGMASSGEGWELLRRTLAGYARHPNIAALVVVGLGCEVNTVSGLVEDLALPSGVPLASYTIQGAGGTAAAVAEGVRLVRTMAADVAGVERVPVGCEHLVLGLQCGGSDGWSGLTANPALGVASDLVVAAGGTAVLAETPEIYGAEHLLAARAVSDSVRDQLMARIRWWEEYTVKQGTTLDGNPSPGNKAGGITTILEKSLGAVAKSGHAPLSAVCLYAEAIPGPGLVFMDTPGYDPVSVTGLVAGGANLVCFTTGRGSVFGSRPAPTVKLATNAETARRMAGDVDLDCSPIAGGSATVEEMGQRVFELLLEVASGRPSASEALGMGGEEMVPWQVGAVL